MIKLARNNHSKMLSSDYRIFESNYERNPKFEQ